MDPIGRRLFARDPTSFPIASGGSMTSCTTGSRSRRAALIRLLCAVALIVRGGIVAAQQPSDGNEPSDDPVSISDDDTAVPPDSLGQNDYACPDTCQDGGSCDISSASEPCCDDDHCAGWFGAEWLRWRLDGGRLPPLVTEGPSTAPLSTVARLHDPDTNVLTDKTVNDDWRNGFRFYSGFWLDGCHTVGIGCDYFDVGNDNYHALMGSDPTHDMGRPFFNTQSGQEDVEFVSMPNELDGTVRVNSNDGLQGAGLLLSNRIWQYCDSYCPGHGAQLILLSGYRFYQYDSNLSVTENITVPPTTMSLLVPGTTFFVQDRLRSENEFHGGEIGLQGVGKHRWWWLDGMAKVAFGEQYRTVTVNGQTIINVPGDTTADYTGGLLTSEATNIGRYRDSNFVLIPEFRLGGGMRVTRCCSIRAGYDVILWAGVARAGSQLPPGLGVDPRNLPPVVAGGGADPEFLGIRGSQLAAQGFDFSVIWQF
jgi:Putative beta barrel porin-7 (BBP7)